MSNVGCRQDSTGRTDRQTERRNKHIVGLPCFEKLSSEHEYIPLEDNYMSRGHPSQECLYNIYTHQYNLCDVQIAHCLSPFH